MLRLLPQRPTGRDELALLADLTDRCLWRQPGNRIDDGVAAECLTRVRASVAESGGATLERRPISRAHTRARHADSQSPRRRQAPRFAESNARRAQQRAEAKRQTRQMLVDAGLDEIIEHGLDVGLEAICARAGYTRGAFYVHFKSREDFLLAITKHVLHAIMEAVLSADGHGGVSSTIERFAETLEKGVWPLVPKIRIATVRVIDAIDRWPTIRAAFSAFLTLAIERLTHLTAREQAAGRVRRDIGARELATVLVTTAFGTIMLTNTGVRTERGRQRALLLALIRPPEGAVDALPTASS